VGSTPSSGTILIFFFFPRAGQNPFGLWIGSEKDHCNCIESV
jgi:hypothetical protein